MRGRASRRTGGPVTETDHNDPRRALLLRGATRQDGPGRMSVSTGKRLTMEGRHSRPHFEQLGKHHLPYMWPSTPHMDTIPRTLSTVLPNQPSTWYSPRTHIVGRRVHSHPFPLRRHPSGPWSGPATPVISEIGANWGGSEPERDVLTPLRAPRRIRVLRDSSRRHPGTTRGLTNARHARRADAVRSGSGRIRTGVTSLAMLARDRVTNPPGQTIRSSRPFLAESHGSGRIRTADLLRVKEPS